MATTPYPLPREARETEIRLGNGGATYGPFGFRIFDVEDVRAFFRPAGAEDFAPAAVAVAKVGGHAFDHFTVTFANPLPATTRFMVQAARLHERDTAVTKAGVLQSAELEKELSKQGSVIEEMRRDIDRGGSPVPGEPGQTLVFSETGMRPGPSAEEIIDASETATGAAAAAQASALAAAADRAQTGLDAAATHADAIATAADRVQTGLDAGSTAADRVQTGLDAGATAADRVTAGNAAAAASASAGNAAASEATATAAEGMAVAAAGVATTARNKAEQWATNPEDVPVEVGPDRYSAFHWAQKAADVVLDGLAGAINGAPTKETPADDDRFPLTDSEAGYVVRRISWANIKAAMSSRLDDAGLAAIAPTITDANLAEPGSFRRFEGTEAAAVAANFPALGGAVMRGWNLATFGVDGGSARLAQIAVEIFGQGSFKGRPFLRVRHDGGWSPWAEIALANRMLPLAGGTLTGRLRIEAGIHHPLYVTAVGADAAAYRGMLGRVETTGDGSQVGPWFGWNRGGVAIWAAGIDLNNNWSLFQNRHEGADGTHRFSVTPTGEIWTSAYGFLHEYIEGRDIGIGQTWQNVGSSRSVNTVYQNTTGKPIQIHILVPNSGGTVVEVSDDNVGWIVVGRSNTTNEQQVIIPPNHYYKGTGGSFNRWLELR